MPQRTTSVISNNARSPGSLAQARAKARSITQSLRIQNPREIDVELIAYARGAQVIRTNLTGCEGRLVRAGTNGIITVNSSMEENGRTRFTIAHELGHFELHRDLKQYAICVDEELPYWYGGKAHENEANAFASALLMPEMLFRPRIGKSAPNLHDIGKIAEEFSTSLTATAIRYVDITSYPCALIQSENTIIRWVYRNAEFKYWIGAGYELRPYTVAVDLFRGKHMESEMQEVPADAWLEGEFASDAIVWEHSLPMPRYSAVITLLWFDEELDSGESEDDSDFGWYSWD